MVLELAPRTLTDQETETPVVTQTPSQVIKEVRVKDALGIMMRRDNFSQTSPLRAAFQRRLYSYPPEIIQEATIQYVAAQLET